MNKTTNPSFFFRVRHDQIVLAPFLLPGLSGNLSTRHYAVYAVLAGVCPHGSNKKDRIREPQNWAQYVVHAMVEDAQRVSYTNCRALGLIIQCRLVGDGVGCHIHVLIWV